MSVQRFILIFLLLISIKNIKIFGQGCNGPVTATVNPKEYCFDGNPIQVQLNGNIVGKSCSVFWEPETDLNDPNILKPTATINGPGMYMYTLYGIIKNPIGSSLIINGSFESGNTGFTSEYIYTAPVFNALQPEGVFTITNPGQTAASVHSDFSACQPQAGARYMVINGNAGSGVKVWCQTVPVNPKTGYLLSAYATSVHPSSPAILQFSINGELLGNVFPLSPSTCNWQNFFECWYSGTATSADICVVNQNTALAGNDFALDNITFTKAQVDSCKVSFKVVEPVKKSKAVAICEGESYKLGTQTFNQAGSYTDIHVKGTGPCDTIYDLDLEVVEISSNILDTAKLNCIIKQMNLNGEVSLNNNLYQFLTYKWTASNGGNIVSGDMTLNPLINKGGKYTLISTYKFGNLTCKDTAFVNIASDTIKPKVTILPNQDTINCQKSILTLNANSSVNPPLSTLKWRAFKNGHIIGVDTLLNIQLDSTGSYELKVTNNINGCIGLDTSFIFKDLAKPMFNLNSPDTLSCNKDSVQLSTNLIDYNLYEYEWKTADGILDHDLDKYTTWAKAAGNYTLIIKNKFNKCLDSLSVKVEADKGVPIAFIDQPLKLSCGKKILNLDGSKSSSGGNITYSWTTIGGNIVSGDSSNKIIIDKTGDYKIVVQNTTNGCVKSYNVLVEIDTLKPLVQIATPEELSCIKATVELDGSNSSTGNNFQYKWTTTNGNIVGSNTTIKTAASKTGTYNLVVTDSLNGCSNNLSIDVKNDTTKPTAIIQTADTLNCINNQLVIDGSKSSKGNRYRYQWSPISGNIVGGSTNLNPTIDQPGNYKLVVTDTILGCKDSANILVIQDITKPKAKLDLPLTLNCKDTLIQINGGNSTTNSGLTKYSWSSLKNGSIGSSNSSLNVNSPDTYSLQIVDLKNGCIDSSSITVNQNIKKPTFTLDTGLILTCIIPSVDINSKIITGAGPFGYLWSTTNGNILTSNTLNTIKVDKSATYLLTIIDSSNYCQENLSTNIGFNKNLPIVALNNPATLNCLDTLSKLLSTGSSTGNEFTYNWTTQNGKIVGSNSDLNVEAAQPGNYTLIISNKNNGCVDSLKTIVNQDIKKPTIQLLPPNEINCLQKIVQVDGSNSSSGKQYNYNWTTIGGNIIGSNTSQKIDVDKPGYYSLIILDNSNFCTKTDSILVTKSADVPIASIDKVDTLNCKVKTINIDGSKSTQGAAFNLQWSATNGGKIIGNSNNNLISTDAPGTYILIVTNISNNCKDTGSIIVAQNIQKPLANATVNDTLSCKKTNLNLNGSNSVAKSIKYNWFTNSGIFTSATNIVSPTVNKAALYQLEIEDLTNFCKDTTSINVLEDIAKPIITLLPTDTLSCKRNSILVASNSSTDYLYNWKGNSILSGQNTNQINVDKSGNYQVVITSKRNGCKDSASVLVNENFVKPIASIQSATILNCINTSVDLNGNGSSSGAKFTYDWTTTNGNIVGSKNTISTKVDKAGDYNLLVTDQVNGCQTNTNITVKKDTIQPIVTIPTPAEITCIKTNIQLIANSNTNFNYQWNTNNGNIVSNKFTNSITVNKKGDYVVTVVNPTNGCSKIATTNVTDFINYPYVDAGTDQQLNCKTNKATLTALDKNIGNFSYLWKNSFGAVVSKSKEAIVGALGTYTYTVKNEDNGCEKTDTVIVFQNRPDAMTLKVTSPKCGETRGSIDVLSVSGGTPSYGFLYGNLVVPGGAHIPHLLPGTYAITVVDANQCTFSTKATVVAPTGFDLKINGEVSVLPGDSIQLHVEANVPKSRIDTLIWSYSNTLNLNDIWNPYAKPEGITRYDVIAIDTNNCRDSAFVVVGIDHPDVYIPNIFTPGNGDGVNDIFMVYSRKEKILKINYLEIFDRWGNKIFTVQNFLPDDALYGWDGTFNNKLMNPGVYVYVTEVEYKDGKKKVYKGDVTLIRE